MNDVVNTQTLLFLKAIQIGVVLAVLYDLVRLLRKLVKHPNWLVQLEDLLYWLGCIVISFSLFYMYNFAQIRFFALIGMALGAILYLVTLSILFMKIATYIIEVLKKFLLALMRLLSVPLRWIMGICLIPIRYSVKQVQWLHSYSYKKKKQLFRKWYYISSDRKAHSKMKRNKTIYKIKRND